jgi:hypothetical protein
MLSAARALGSALLLVSATFAPHAAAAQAPGIPVLQSAFYNRGFAVGINVAGGGGSALAGAVAYAPLAGQVVIVAGGGTVSHDNMSEPTAGFRIAYRFRTFGADRQIGAAVFLGAGTTLGAAKSRVGRTPVGLSLAYRRALGETRALALYAAPYYDGTRVKIPDQATVTGSRFRSAVGVDVAVTPSIGAGLGVDFGGAGEPKTALAGATQFGAGLSYHF